jgi:hypothetical protein
MNRSAAVREQEIYRSKPEHLNPHWWSKQVQVFPIDFRTRREGGCLCLCLVPLAKTLPPAGTWAIDRLRAYGKRHLAFPRLRGERGPGTTTCVPLASLGCFCQWPCTFVQIRYDLRGWMLQIFLLLLVLFIYYGWWWHWYLVRCRNRFSIFDF